MPKKKPFCGPCIAHGPNHEPIVAFCDLRPRGGAFRPANDSFGTYPEYAEIPPCWTWKSYSKWLKNEVGKLVKPSEVKFVEPIINDIQGFSRMRVNHFSSQITTGEILVFFDTIRGTFMHGVLEPPPETSDNENKP